MATLDLALALDSPVAGEGVVGSVLRVCAHEYATVNVTCTQTLDDSWIALDDTGLFLDEGARVNVQHTVLGAGASATGLAGGCTRIGVSSSSFSRSSAAAAVCQMPLTEASRRSGSKASPMAVKKLMNWPTVLSPSMISAPPYSSTPMNPTPAITSTIAVIKAVPKDDRTSERTKVSVCCAKRSAWYSSRLFSLIGTMPWNTSSSRVASFAPRSRASAAFLRT